MSAEADSEPLLPYHLRELLVACIETRSVEYKASMSWGEARLKLVKTALAMANLPDGGRIVIGVNEVAPGRLHPVGMKLDDYNTYQSDGVNDAIRQHADPPFAVTLHRGRGSIQSGLFIVVEVPPFDELPVICRQDGGPSSELRAGAIYTRSIHKPETTEVRESAEMREIIERAVDKGIAKLQRRFPSLAADDRAAFQQERGTFE